MVNKILLKHIFVVLFVLMPLPTQAEGLKTYEIDPPEAPRIWHEENSDGQIQHTIIFDNRERHYQTYVPSQDKGNPKGAILLLHGTGRTGVSLVEKWKPIADQNNLVLIGPTAIQNWNPAVDSLEFLDTVLEDAKKQYNIDSKRIYLFGHSQGACYALYVSAFRSTKFAATSIHAGQFFAPSGYQSPAMSTRKIPVVFLNGTNDTIFHLEPVTASAQAFADSGHPVSLYILKGHTHWYYDLAPFINEKAWEFLSQYHL